MRELGEFCDNYDVVIRLEVHGRGISDLPRIRTIMEIADHPNVGVCWNSNTVDLACAGFEANFDMAKQWINAIHMRDLYNEAYPDR